MEPDGRRCRCNKYFVFFGLSYIFMAILGSLPMTLFEIISEQTNSSEGKMSTIFTVIAVIGIICGIVTGYIVNKIDNYHYLLSVYCLFAAIAIVAIYFSESYYLILIEFIIIQSASSGLAIAQIVGIFRVFNIDGSWIVSFNLFIMVITLSLIPQIISISIKYFDNYSYSMYLFSIIGFINVILFILISSPKHQKLIKDVNKITNDIHKSLQLEPQSPMSVTNTIDEKIKQYKNIHSIAPKLKKKFNPSHSMPIAAQCNSLIIKELNTVYKEIKRNEQNDKIVMNLFVNASDTIIGESFEAKDDCLTSPVSKSLVSLRQCSISFYEYMSEAYWFDFERQETQKEIISIENTNTDNTKYKEFKHVIEKCATVAIITEWLKGSNRGTFLTFITVFISTRFKLSTMDGLNLITTQFVGQLIGQFVTILLLKIIKPRTIMILCCFIMLISSLLLLASVVIIDEYVMYILYPCAFLNGFGSIPLYTATLTFLCNVQPLTGILSSLYNSADAASGFTITAIGILINVFGVNVLIYTQVITVILMMSLFIINHIKYSQMLKLQKPQNSNFVKLPTDATSEL
eukprot:301034_1